MVRARITRAYDVGENANTVGANANTVGANANTVGANACGACVRANYASPSFYLQNVPHICYII